MIRWSENQIAKLSTGYGYAPDSLYAQISKTDLPIMRVRPSAPDELDQLLNSLPLGYFANLDGSNDVLVNVSLPEFFYKSKKYSVGYTFWETNQLPKGWADHCNRMDEIWTCSAFMTEVFINSGVEVPVLNFKLGVDPELFFPVLRERHREFTFLSIGSPSTRKNSQMAVDAFLKLFGNKDGFRLIYKSSGPPDARMTTGGLKGPLNHHAITVIDKEVSVEELSKIYDRADCLLYPTSGEGWGMIPFQGIAKGIPTICTNATACEEFANLSVPLDYEWSDCNMNGIYKDAGQWAKPSFDDLCDKMLYVVNNYEKVSDKTFASAQFINKNMTWENVSKDYIKRLWKILNLHNQQN
jgi:glycosyltransferase involved in cell wall biosynthesis